MDTQGLIQGAINLICFVPAIVIHEVAHGFVAHRLGDPTAKNAGRLSLNPLKHIDPFGTVILPIILALTPGTPVFGYAKPVPYNPRYFKNLKVGEVLTAFAGPAANLLMALLAACAAFVIRAVTGISAVEGFVHFSYGMAQGTDWVGGCLIMFALINLYLMFFNLLPIPPLDGSSIIVPFLPKKVLPTWYQIQRYALPILIILVMVVPMFTHLDPLGAYLRVTAGNLVNLFFSF